MQNVPSASQKPFAPEGYQGQTAAGGQSAAFVPSQFVGSEGRGVHFRQLTKEEINRVVF